MSVRFILPGLTVTIQNPDLGDRLARDQHQAIQPKAGGGFYRYALAAAADLVRELRWSNLRRSELDSLVSFFEDEAEGSLNVFTFVDERGASWTAHFLDASLDPETVADDAASSGTFSAGGYTVPTTTRSGGVYALGVRLSLAALDTTTTLAPTTTTSA